MKILLTCRTCRRLRPTLARGLCGTCYQKHWASGSLLENDSHYAARFKRKRLRNTEIDKATECWVWQGLTYNGYGWSCLHSKSEFLHRASYLLFVGPLKKGEVVRHTCDNRKCWNPAHLVKGSHHDNMQDAVARGRISRGVDRHNALLDEDKVRLIRSMLSEGKTHIAIAQQLGCSRSNISKIAHGKTWAHVT